MWRLVKLLKTKDLQKFWGLGLEPRSRPPYRYGGIASEPETRPRPARGDRSARPRRCAVPGARHAAGFRQARRAGDGGADRSGDPAGPESRYRPAGAPE